METDDYQGLASTVLSVMPMKSCSTEDPFPGPRTARTMSEAPFPGPYSSEPLGTELRSEMRSSEIGSEMKLSSERPLPSREMPSMSETPSWKMQINRPKRGTQGPSGSSSSLYRPSETPGPERGPAGSDGTGPTGTGPKRTHTVTSGTTPYSIEMQSEDRSADIYASQVRIIDVRNGKFNCSVLWLVYIKKVRAC